MAKAKTIFLCNNCGYESAKWLGKCPACNEWNSFVEEKIKKEENIQVHGLEGKKSNKPTLLNSVEGREEFRVKTRLYRAR